MSLLARRSNINTAPLVTIFIMMMMMMMMLLTLTGKELAVSGVPLLLIALCRC